MEFQDLAYLKLVRFCRSIGYPLEVTRTQRIIGPRQDSLTPPQGTEVFVSNIPGFLLEDDIFALFLEAGPIHKFRLLTCTVTKESRGLAYITFKTCKGAQNAVAHFNDLEIAPGMVISVKKSSDNRRLFLGGICDTLHKDDVWNELDSMGVKGVTDVIMYKSYINKTRNRGFVFVEFSTHQEAAAARYEFRNMIMFGERVHLEWSTPLPEVDDHVMSKVKKLFLRNLSIYETRDHFAKFLGILLKGLTTEKIYKYRDYAFIHFKTRHDAELGLRLLKEYYLEIGEDVDIEWAKPPTKTLDWPKRLTCKPHVGKRWSNEIQLFEATSDSSFEATDIEEEIPLSPTVKSVINFLNIFDPVS